ncbi:serine protease [Planctomicrobium sp. SH661]|uniref:serine protease n=1 Tax=Planctomicrobium sp. SH661 TaxID=3448124 RepID=UPI003F5B9A93
MCPLPAVLRSLSVFGLLTFGFLGWTSSGLAQSVGLPAPRLLTIMPMGGQAGTTVEVGVTGENIDDTDAELLFSSPGISAVPAKTAEGALVPNRFVVTIAADAPAGICDARVKSDLGVSTARAFTIGHVPEVVTSTPNTTLETALALPANSVCNATTSAKAVDYYTFTSTKGTRTIIECAARTIDSKLVPVVIVADAQGRDLQVNRLTGLIDFVAPADGTFVVKIHDLTFRGGASHFYRLALTTLGPTDPIANHPATLAVNSFSRPIEDLAALLPTPDTEPNNKQSQAQKITLPCVVGGTFFPAADVDTFEFTAKKSETWWIEVVSERLGLATNPFVLVQRVIKDGDREVLADVAEFSDIPHAIGTSSNGYSYDGPPYQTGSTDVLGKLVIPEDGTYRLQLRDLYGGTRSDPQSAYQLMIRHARPDFSIVAWAMHTTLRNGDRSALSKPIALRPGATIAFDVAVIRKDDFAGEIRVSLEDLPAGISAAGLTIPAGKNAGTLLISAKEDAAPCHGIARFVGQAEINGVQETRLGKMASMSWPVGDAWGEIPVQRLLADIPVSIGQAELAPLTITPAEDKVWTVAAGEKLTIPLKLTWREEFSGAFSLSAFGAGFEKVKDISIPLQAEAHDLVLDFAELKTPPGDYTIGLYGGAVAKHQHRLDRVKLAEASVQVASQALEAASSASRNANDVAQAAPDEQKAAAQVTADEAAKALKLAEQTRTEADNRLQAARQAAAPKDIVDIMVTTPIRIRVEPKAEESK